MSNVPQMTAGQWLGELGQGGPPAGLARGRYPELMAQLDALREIAPNSKDAELAALSLQGAATHPEGSEEEGQALAKARIAIHEGLRRAGGPDWKLLVLVVALIGVVALWMWRDKQRPTPRRRPARNQPDDGDDDDEDGDDEDGDD